MAVQDLWVGADGKPTARNGRGKRWRVVLPGHPSRAFATKHEARWWETELTRRGPLRTSGLTVKPLVERWLAGKAGLSGGYREQCEAAAERVIERWGGASPESITRADVQAWIADMTVKRPRGERVPASHTIRSKALQALGGALRIAREQGAVEALATDGVAVPKARRKLPRALTLDQLRALAEACEMPEAIWLLGTTGLRISEATVLTVGDVDRKRARLRVAMSKNGTGREVPISRSVLAMLSLDRKPTEPLLVHPRGNSLDRKAFRQHVLLRAADAAGIEGLTTHHLRHTAVSLAIKSGADVKVVQRMVGHKSAAMTLDVYGHLWDGGLDELATRLDRDIAAIVPDSYRTPSD